MRKSARPLPFFDSRSVLLFAAISLGGVAAMHAQAADKTPPTGVIGPTSSGAKPAPPAAANPANQAPALSQKHDAPPMTTSPAFGPVSAADKATGSANNPDKRPEINATSPGSSTAASAAFDRADTNKDGRLSAAEAKKLPAISERFKKLDSNHDGHLSRDEFNEGAKS